MKEADQKYFLGLDIGTGSVGWAVTDKEYNILKSKKRDLWGSRLFETAQTAAQRRIFRGARRRIERRHKRLMLLQELFAEEITKKDPSFFMRMQDSFLQRGDKRENQKNSLFNDPGFRDKDYHKKYPTIHHLIKAFIDGEKIDDIRLLYLACHNIIKKRGHFLFNVKSFDNKQQVAETLKNIFEFMREDLNLDNDWDKNIEQIEGILKNKRLKPSEKETEIKEILNLSSKDKQRNSIIKLILGLKANFKDLFDDEELKKDFIKFSEIDFEAKADEFTRILGEERFELILKGKAVYNAIVLENILTGETYLSYAKVATYEKHKNDLAKLKELLKNTSKTHYTNFFKNNEIKSNYISYVGLNLIKGKKQVIDKKCSKDEFYNSIENLLNELNISDENQAKKEILNDIELDNFLPLQIDKKNSEIPYQLRKLELQEILTNASQVFEFLNKKDEQNWSIAEKIISLLEFRIPYYIGTTNDFNIKKFPDRCWVVKKENGPVGKLAPWNFEDKIDKEATAEKFIKVRTNKCSYLIGEDVLPRHSLIYSEYSVLNEINNLKIYDNNGVDIFDVNLKNKIYTELFKQEKKVTQTKIKTFLINNNLCKKGDKIIIEGIDNECTSSLASYISLKNIFGDKIENDSTKAMLEDIIAWSSIFDSGEGRDLLKKKINDKYKNNLSEEELKKVLDLKFSGWGTLSRKLLDGISVELPELNGQKTSLINAMRETNLNLSELVLTNQAPFAIAIEEHNKEFNNVQIKEFSYKNLVENLFLSPSVKRMLWQTLLVVDEVKRIKKGDPEKIFIEMARAKEKNGSRTKSRKDLIENLYKNCTKDVNNWKDDLKRSKSEIANSNNLQLRSDKLYLYYTQLGRCAYSEKNIELDRLFDTNHCDIDHIYPQSLRKDDSLDNRVLVFKENNQAKKDIYPLSAGIRKNMNSFWHFLLENNFISKEKYARLIRSSALSPDEIGEFLARQLVETRQATKKAAEVLKSIFPNTEIVYSKAGHISDFRQVFGLHKCREVNNLHHAKDAYLNIVVGNVLNVRFTKNPRNFVKEKSNNKENESKEKQNYNFKKLFEKMFQDKDNKAWNLEKSKTLLETLERNTPICTRHSFCKSGGLFDQTLMKKGKGQFPIKASLLMTQEEKDSIQKYGGYNKPAADYFVLVERKIKEEIIRTLEVVPVYLTKAIEENKQILLDYLKELLGTNKFKIILPKIKINSLFLIDGFAGYITGKSNDSFLIRNAIELFITNEETLYFKKILKSNATSREMSKSKQVYLPAKDKTLVEYVKLEICKKKEEDTISEQEFEQELKQKNLETYDKFIKLHKSVYKDRLNSSVITILQNGRGKFIDLNLSEQLKTIEEILRIFRPVNEASDLSLIGGSKFAGKMALGKNLSNLKSCFLINKSVTGIYETKINLLNIKAKDNF